MKININALTKRIKNGDKEAYTLLFKEYYAPLVSYSIGFTRDREAAEDVVQYFFCNFWEERGSISEPGVSKTYLYTSIRNRSLNWLRDRRTLSLDDRFDSCSEEDLLLDIHEEEIYKRLHLVLQQLPERCREVFLLRLSGKSNREIALELGVSEDTVRSHFRHGKGLIRKAMSLFISLFSFFSCTFLSCRVYIDHRSKDAL